MTNTNEIQLVKNVRVKLEHSRPVRQGAEVWRIVVNFISDFSDKNKIIKKYYIWVTGEYLEDKTKLSADIQSAEIFALQIAQKRFEKSGKQVPIENGIYCNNKDGIIFINPKEFAHFVEREK